jgi:CRISPR system Cascade subunit CasE
MNLFMLQMEPDMMRLTRWAKNHGVLPHDVGDDLGYTLHALLAACFGNAAPKPFSLQLQARTPNILGYSALAADTLRAQALEFALPDALAALNLDSLVGKRMPDSFAAGRELGFTVRVRPMVRTDRDGNRARSREIDAFQAAIPDPAEESVTLRAEVYRDWLTRRMAQGGCLVRTPLTLSALQRTAVFRRDRHRGLRRIGGSQGGPDVTFSGILRVTEPEKFRELLARGIGRHRAFGFGMLLLRPA